MERPHNPHTYINRRKFLRLSGILGAGLAVGGILPVSAEAVKFNTDEYKVDETRSAMSTTVTMILIHPSKTEAQEAIGRAFEEIYRLEGLMNSFDDSTAVGSLNRQGSLIGIPSEVLEVIRSSLRYHGVTGGNFDITVKPVIELFSCASQGKSRYPDKREIEEAFGLVGSSKIEINGRDIRFRQPGMGITLDGIAKGYIVDRASALLSRYNIRNHLINAGGDIRARGSQQGNRPWKVAVQDPQKKGEYPDIIHLNDGAIATSGNYEVYFDSERMSHHIVDPKTGLSPMMSTSVSVLAKTAMEADAFSTSVFVMGHEAGTRFIDSRPGCESLVLQKMGKAFRSAGWCARAAI